MGRRGPECTVCESQNYILRNGFYFCTMCQTQSQELGAEMVIDEDGMYAMGMIFVYQELGAEMVIDEDGMYAMGMIFVYQELGAEMVIDEDGMYAMGMMNKTLRIGEKEPNSKTRKTAEVDRWSTAEGLTHILAHWVDQLESYGFKNIRQPALDVWSRYLKSLGVAFLPPKGEMNEDRRSVSTMNYRDKWLFFGGPANLVEPRVISRNLKRKGDQVDHEYNDDDDDDDYEGLTERQIFKQRDKKRRAFYKSFSASFVAGDTPSKLSTEKNERKRKELEDLEEHEEHTENEEHEGHAEHEGHEVPNEQDDDKEEEDYENHEERIEPEHQKKEEYTVKDSVQEEQEEDIQNDQEEHQDQELEYEDQEEENQQSVNDSLFSDGSGRSNYELLSDLESLVSRSSLEYSGTDKLETWIHLSLENLKAVLVLAATCVPGTDLNTSDIAYMFSSEMLINSTSLQALPESYKLMASERRFYSGFKSGIVFEKEENLRSKALKLASFVGLTNNKRLVLSTHDCTRSTLDRYVEDLSLPEYISTEIIRILALILVTLKFYCGLDGQQEYIHDHNAKTLNKKLVGEDRKFFNVLDWIRKSKLRLDYLTADDFVMREQFRSMKGPGTPAPTLRSMDESRTVLENTARKQHNTKSNVFDGLKYVVTVLGAEPLAQKEKMKTLQPLKEKTAALIHETKNKRLASSLNDLMAMTSEDMSIYCKVCGFFKVYKTLCVYQYRLYIG
ncbi:uncharacterized protein LOC111698760 isoform X2 [Eurytemora carolleeae]|uniref:uncharacterized protein LOC111698760 isoform X2 n=1 Tax=Eurytemora carolleeae TaxID=1294199 RepID=UPI000C7727D2|nr:uncharacterized protein LOC111698760 isoform X2 [Eurytemora carolleeae]|eukprot:XP_023324947.1 uncharacterized protein LOC111698760 isoform X2 [Eurytemora affinis]